MTSEFAGGLRSDFKLRTENMMVNFNDIMETITMIQEENLDIRTITMGISLLDCADSDIDVSCQKIYEQDNGQGRQVGGGWRIHRKKIRYSHRQ